jgi:RraA family protein
MSTVHVHDVRRPDLALVDRFAQFATADVANALGDEAAICDPAIRPVWRSPTLLGVALTVRLPPHDNLGLVIASLTGQPGDVLVIDGGGDATAALAGGRLARVAMSRGIRGFIVDGAVRDLAELERLGLPVHARTVSPRRASKTGDAVIGCALTCGGARVCGGDLVLADRDGVVVIPQHLIERALPRVEAVAASEREEEPDFTILERRFQAAMAQTTVIQLPADQ